jgi:hypothetical protein
MAIRHSAAAFFALLALSACGPDTPAKPNGPVGTAASASASPSDSPSPSAAAVPVVPTPAVTTAPAPATTEPAPAETTEDEPEDVYYKNCAAAKAAGAAPLRRGDPGYRSGLDRDGDGVACE